VLWPRGRTARGRKAFAPNFWAVEKTFVEKDSFRNVKFEAKNAHLKKCRGKRAMLSIHNLLYQKFTAVL